MWTMRSKNKWHTHSLCAAWKRLWLKIGSECFRAVRICYRGIDGINIELRYLRYGCRTMVLLLWFGLFATLFVGSFIRLLELPCFRTRIRNVYWICMTMEGHAQNAYNPLRTTLAVPLICCVCFLSHSLIQFVSMLFFGSVCALAKNKEQKNACCCSLSVRFLALFGALELWLTRLYCKPRRIP